MEPGGSSLFSKHLVTRLYSEETGFDVPIRAIPIYI
jgi:hypothetical protein